MIKVMTGELWVNISSRDIPEHNNLALAAEPFLPFSFLSLINLILAA